MKYKLILNLVEPIAWLCSRKSFAVLAYKLARGGGGYSGILVYSKARLADLRSSGTLPVRWWQRQYHYACCLMLLLV